MEARDKKVQFRMSQSMLDSINHFADQRGQSKNQFVVDAIDHFIDWIVRDYDLPTAETERLNQLIERMDAMESNQRSALKQQNQVFDLIIGLINGESYLNDSGDRQHE